MAASRRTALITGAGRNIGRACALGLAADGFNVVINGSSDRAACDRVAREARKLGVKALVVMGDAGKPFLEMSDAAWRRVIAVDLDAAVWLARACLPGMLKKGWGRIVNFTGMNAIHGYAGRAPVSVAKHGVWGLTKSLAKEFGPQGVTVNAISPGPIASDVEEDDASSHHRQQTVAKVPLGRMGTPAEVAAAARLLISDGGAYINGQMIQVNGGAET